MILAGMRHERLYRGGAPAVGFGAPPSHWHKRALERLAEMDRLIAAGRGDELVQGGGCTEPGGGIVSMTHTAREMAAMLRGQLEAGLGQAFAAPTVAATSPWTIALVTSTVSAAAGWVIEEIATHVRRRKRRRR